jgi:hypothetical protein
MLILFNMALNYRMWSGGFCSLEGGIYEKTLNRGIYMTGTKAATVSILIVVDLITRYYYCLCVR